MGDTDPVAQPAEKTSSAGSTSKFQLKLYVAGSDSRTRSAIENLQHICDTELAGQYELEVIDVLERPDEAEDAKILATPTLIKQLPPPLRRVIGDLSDKQKLLLGLEIRPTATPNTDGRAK